MADTNSIDGSASALRPMTDADVTASAEPRTGTGTAGRIDDVKATIKDKGADLRVQATDKALAFAEDGKAKATGALDQLSQMLTDAAGSVDEKLGEQYGQYARTAAEGVRSLSSSLGDKSVDELAETVRDFVRKSPAVAIGAAAAVGFVVARLLSSGLDQRDRA